MMRLASALLILTMVTTCAISGTFAKYVTEAKTTDTARVAKWGVTVDAVGSLFGQDYYSQTTDSKNSISAVVSNNAHASGDYNIVAPGTESEKGLTLSVKGTPEVAYSIAYATPAGTDNQEIWLLNGNYGVLVETDKVTADNYVGYYYAATAAGPFTKATDTYVYSGSEKWYDLHDQAEVTTDKYYPIVWTVTKNGTTGTLSTSTYSNVEEMNNALSGEFGAATNNANEKIDDSYTITWAWAFTGQNDGADTILGNLQTNDNSGSYVVVKTSDSYATCTTLASDDYNLEVEFGAQITVTQID